MCQSDTSICKAELDVHDVMIHNLTLCHISFATTLYFDNLRFQDSLSCLCHISLLQPCTLYLNSFIFCHQLIMKDGHIRSICRLHICQVHDKTNNMKEEVYFILHWYLST